MFQPRRPSRTRGSGADAAPSELAEEPTHGDDPVEYRWFPPDRVPGEDQADPDERGRPGGPVSERRPAWYGSDGGDAYDTDTDGYFRPRDHVTRGQSPARRARADGPRGAEAPDEVPGSGAGTYGRGTYPPPGRAAGPEQGDGYGTSGYERPGYDNPGYENPGYDDSGYFQARVSETGPHEVGPHEVGPHEAGQGEVGPRDLTPPPGPRRRADRDPSTRREPGTRPAGPPYDADGRYGDGYEEDGFGGSRFAGQGFPAGHEFPDGRERRPYGPDPYGGDGPADAGYAGRGYGEAGYRGDPRYPDEDGHHGAGYEDSHRDAGYEAAHRDAAYPDGGFGALADQSGYGGGAGYGGAAHQGAVGHQGAVAHQGAVGWSGAGQADGRGYPRDARDEFPYEEMPYGGPVPADGPAGDHAPQRFAPTRDVHSGDAAAGPAPGDRGAGRQDAGRQDDGQGWPGRHYARPYPSLAGTADDGGLPPLPVEKIDFFRRYTREPSEDFAYRLDAPGETAGAGDVGRRAGEFDLADYEVVDEGAFDPADGAVTGRGADPAVTGRGVTAGPDAGGVPGFGTLGGAVVDGELVDVLDRDLTGPDLADGHRVEGAATGAATTDHDAADHDAADHDAADHDAADHDAVGRDAAGRDVTGRDVTDQSAVPDTDLQNTDRRSTDLVGADVLDTTVLDGELPNAEIPATPAPASDVEAASTGLGLAPARTPPPAEIPGAGVTPPPGAVAGGGKAASGTSRGEDGVVPGVGDGAALERLAERVEELVRLRRHDADLVDRLHAENGRLRAGELTEAIAPLLRGLIRLHDQMSSLGAEDAQSVAGILRKQLLQILDLAVDVRPYTAEPGSPFDPERHLGVRRVGTDDPALDQVIARTVRPGFVRGESAVIRPAETEVYRAH